MGDFRADMAAASVYPLWERENRHNMPPEAPHVWRWATMNPLIDGAVAATDMGNAERRVLVLRNPAFGNSERDGAAVNLSVNLQVLMPGEKARPHRHSMNALRFALEGDGATTVVEGKACVMLPGDMILTPAWTWHEHAHEGRQRAVWVDALDVPLHSYLETGVFEPGPAHDLVPLPPDAAFAAAGLAPDTAAAQKPYSPLFRYPWDLAAKALAALPAETDGSRRLRYTNPLTGGAIMATLDCYLLGLAPGMETVPYRTNSNCVCVVMAGEGQSRVGEDTIAWGPKDVFSLPHGQWISHKATSGNPRLFQITDRELLRRLDILRDEIRH
ncbi:MAG TPA: cupin domain-containing protein [Stellaceae bacterium]|nr:cupin domain-containing protein [Stellaceae bacterium]